MKKNLVSIRCVFGPIMLPAPCCLGLFPTAVRSIAAGVLLREL